MSSRAGYTLLEMMVAITIFLMIMITVGMGSVSIQKTWSRVQKHSNDLKANQMIDRAISPAFKNAVPFVWKDKSSGGTKSIFVGEGNTVTLAYLHRMNRLTEGGIRFIRLRVKDDALIAEYSNVPMLHWENDEPSVRTEVLSPGVRNISFEYYLSEDDKLEEMDTWDNESYDIPEAIQMTIEWKNGRTETWLRRTAGSGFKEELNVRK